MRHLNGFWRGLTVLVVLLAVGIGFVPVCMAHGDDGRENPRILPPDSNAFGASYGEWSAAWWRWAISIPFPVHPLADAGSCDTGQSGKVWFLGGSFTGAPAVRECTVPAGKAIFFPVVNVECSTVEPDPFHGSNEAELRACAKAFMDPATGLAATIDGRPVQNLTSFRVQSPLFNFSAPDNNVLFVPGPISGQSISDGYWLMLAPPSAGRHTIHFECPIFGQDVTYHLRIVGGRGRGEFDGEPGAVEPATWGLVKELYRR